MRKLSSLSLFSRLYLTIAIAMIVSGSVSFYFIEKMHVQGAIDEYVLFTDQIYADLIEQKKFIPDVPIEQLSKEVHGVEGYLISWKIVLNAGPPCDECEWVADSGDVDVYRNALNQWFSVYKLANMNAWMVIFENNVFNFSELEQAQEEQKSWLSSLAFHDFEELTQLMVVFLTVALAIYWPVRIIKVQIESLIKTQHQFGAGDMSVRAANTYAKPIDELASSFNDMADSISDTFNENQVFAQAVPHEARTPLSRIQLAVGLLSQNNTNSQQMALLDSISSYIGDVNLLINQVVAFSKLNSLNDENELSSCRTIKLSTFIESRISATQCEQKHEVIRDIDTSIKILANPAYLRLLLDNVLKNAAIHGKKRISIRLTKLNGHLNLSVEDDGDGVPPEHIDKIFIPFYRVDASRSRKTGGLGLGLAIANAASKRIGGVLSIENIPLSGAKFMWCLSQHGDGSFS